MNQRQEDAQAATKVTIDLMEEHLIQPTKTQTMIQDFMANLTRDMKTLSNNSTSHATSLEELLYHRVISIEGQHEAWEAYVRDKDK
jgi:hemerythrin superfamily protein